ncbi:MAG: cellulase family glycosylhydrolase [bacterium]|nr:cellulase family glycosylhydrolase [bacterium]
MRTLYKVLVGLVGVFILIIFLLAFPSFYPDQQEYGVSFSAPHASGLGLNWKEAYQALLVDVGVKHLRLSAYWDSIEKQQGVYDFSDLDYQIQEAEKNNADILLAVGKKLPRWPECHVSAWARDISEQEQQRAVLELVSRVVTRYKHKQNVVMWQLENEPLLSFGICPPVDVAFVQEEQKLLRTLDPARPILVTDSGELNSWLGASKYGDILGTTMYRTVFSGRTKKLFHYDYLFPSWAYRVKARYIGLLRNKPVLISELQGEPWGSKPFTEMTGDERKESFSSERFIQLAGFAKRTQLTPVYWWGAEYWYWEKIKNGNSEYMDIAKELFSLEGGDVYGK